RGRHPEEPGGAARRRCAGPAGRPRRRRRQADRLGDGPGRQRDRAHPEGLSRVPIDEQEPPVAGPPPRSGPERVADTLAKLRQPVVDVWVSSASVSEDGSLQPYVVPLSLAWIDDRVVLALESDSRPA